ncbi:type VI secretion system-associated protein [Serratia sp. L9]|uniref:type VI secretion system-associated protein n=1 Tax=Serratia sp. L9 TaxID=3423946 RepID=UPI003D674A37
MKYWMLGIIALTMTPAVQAENYRLAYSPTLKLEVYIDDVTNSKPESWCAGSIPLRITSTQNTDTYALSNFLPSVGNLLEKQCPKVVELPWILADQQGNKIASGNVRKDQKWQPVIPPSEATNSSAATTLPVVAVTSPLATPDNTMVSFSLPQGCQFRTYWNDNLGDSTIFVPSSDAFHCDPEGLLNGHGTIVTSIEGVNQTHNVVFYRGYPLLNIETGNLPLKVVRANAQRLILGGQAVSWC